jgi:hypothetical protein
VLPIPIPLDWMHLVRDLLPTITSVKPWLAVEVGPPGAGWS